MKANDWLKQIPASLLQWDDIPLTGAAPEFPWNDLAEKLSNRFGLKDINIELLDTKWRTEKEFYENIPDPLFITLTVGTLEGSLVWAMSKDDIALMVSDTLLNKRDTNLANLDIDLVKSFYTFAAMEVIHSLKELAYLPSLSIHLAEEELLPKEAALCFDLTIHLNGNALSGRLMLSTEFRKGWAKHFTPKVPNIYFEDPLAEKVHLTLSMETGKITLSQKQWDSVAVGDFIVLDRCTVDPDNAENGSILLKINDIPMFNAEINDGHVKILEQSQVYQG